jgi:hypothetical protein
MVCLPQRGSNSTLSHHSAGGDASGAGFGCSRSRANLFICFGFGIRQLTGRSFMTNK